MNNIRDHEAAFIEECEKRGVRVVRVGQFSIGTAKQRAESIGAHFETTPEAPFAPALNIIADAMTATRVRFGLPPEVEMSTWGLGVEYSVGDEVEGSAWLYLSEARLVEWLEDQIADCKAGRVEDYDQRIGRWQALEEVLEYVHSMEKS